ncbi:zinc finger protein with KRAB and SCAN domains 1-like isoform X5 [Lethenteron reissneri]|uniref:zinc finger protein with KRAB and SCAN domains 1-like isoform X5 n=1 Tax=Lethenteron reissneri TaxID=7753 RepID=UPI002AB690FB|nr:zinc finger protein with KRAB and SCAN domains 1-like isoform X5 [Lethenteron reissneri]
MPPKRKSYTAAFKLQVCKFAEDEGNRAAGKAFSVDEKSVREWRKSIAELKAMHPRKRARRGPKAKWPQLEDNLVKRGVRMSRRSVSKQEVEEHPGWETALGGEVALDNDPGRRPIADSSSRKKQQQQQKLRTKTFASQSQMSFRPIQPRTHFCGMEEAGDTGGCGGDTEPCPQALGRPGPGKEFAAGGGSKKFRRSRPYKCLWCPEAFTLRSALVTHARSHTGERPHMCAVCGKGFEKPSKLRSHARSHTGERPHLCPVCGKRFAWPSDARRHIALDAGHNPLCCSVCGKNFVRSLDLYVHMAGHAEERLG